VMKKEQLIEELARVRFDRDNLLLKDQQNRKEFAKAFQWHKQPNPYSGAYGEPPEPILPSWEQIWVNLGTLLAARNFMDMEGNVSEIEMRLNDLEGKIKKEIHPNLS
jgi:hypothetical protein